MTWCLSAVDVSVETAVDVSVETAVDVSVKTAVETASTQTKPASAG